jgi:amino acid adenylation domain-containing protein
MNQLQAALRAAFERHAGRDALRDETSALTYADLARASNHLAHSLRTRGVRPGHIVPLLLCRSVPLVVAEVALVRLGAAYAPIDVASPSARQAAMLEAIHSSLLLTDGTPIVQHIDGLAQTPTFDVIAWWEEQRTGLTGAAPELWLDAPEGHPAYVMFTSGSTGAPKGVMAPASGILRLVASGPHIAFDADQRWGFVSSPAFDASTLEVWGPLLNGGCCVVQQEDLPALDALGGFLQRHRITDAFLTSALFNAMVDDQLPALGSFGQLLAGGERVSPAHARRLLEAHPSVRLINGYGPTEDTTFTLCHRVTLADTQSTAGVPIGRPLPGTRIRIDDNEGGSTGTEGELWTSGAGLAHGYLDDPALSARRFVERDGRRWYRTGDLVRRNLAGDIEFLGRVDRQIKLRGHRIELDGIELALARCRGVGDAAVIAIGDGADARRMVAAVSPLAGASLDAASLDRQMRERFPETSVPGDYRILARLPRTLNGKVDRHALEKLWSRAVEQTFSARLQAIFDASGARPALEDSDEALSYAELSRRSEILAAHLVRLGLQAGDRLAIFLPRSVALVVAMVAAVRIGAVYVPIDLASPAARIGRIVAWLEPRFAIVDTTSPVDLPPACVCIDKRAWIDLSLSDSKIPWAAPSPDAPLYITFTSGSTGTPKGIVVPSRGLMRLLVDADWAAFPQDARWLFATSPAFDISNLEIWGALLNGACCVVQEGRLPSLDELARRLIDKRISHAQMSTALFNAMVDTQLPSLAGLEQFITGGERASPPHMRKFLLAHPQVRLINAYGPSETTVWSASRTVTLRDTHESAGVPIGLPVGGTLLHVDVAGGTAIGELLIGGAGVALGYLDDDAQTQRQFVARDGSRWYRSGDLAVQRADGLFEFHGRADRQVKLQGQRIEIDEVELVLAACSGVGEVAVLLRGDDPASRHLAACYSGLGNAAPNPDRVREYLSAKLAAAAVPTELLALERLPRSLNGKVDRDALAALLDAQRAAPSSHMPAAESAFEGEFERALARIWQDLLPLQPLSRDAHFMRSGGTSLLALHVSAVVRKQLRRELSPVDVLRHPVLSEQARVLSKLDPLPNAEPSRAALPGVSVPITRNQQNILAASRLDPTGCAYLVHVALLWPAEPDWAALRAAFEQLALRHPALRLMALHDGLQGYASLQTALAPGWWQQQGWIDAAPLDLSWPADLLASINRPLDTAARGVMRVDAWPVTGGRALVVWTVHHCVIDEAGIDIALAEIDVLMNGHKMAPVYGSPFAFKAIESAWTDRADIRDWSHRFAAAWAGAAAPLDRPPAAGKEVGFPLPPFIQAALARRCDALGVTPFPIMLTAYGLALQDVFGPRFRFVLTPFSRRALPELVEPISYLCDTVVVEAGARASESLAETQRRVAAEVLSGQTPRFHLMEDLANAVGAIDPAAASGLWQFGFTWRLDASRPLPMGPQRATLIRVPQCGARHSICLHAAQIGGDIRYSIEAVDGAFHAGQVAAVARAFDAHLAALCALTEPVPTQTVPFASRAAAPARINIDTVDDQVLREAWARRLGVPATSIVSDSHFLRDGGSSLTAMRLAADLRRACGFKLDIGAFLADPTFARLSAMRAEKLALEVEGCVMVGPRDFSHVLLLLPGALGHAAGLFGLAQALHARMPAGGAVAIFDLDAALEAAPPSEPLWSVTRRIAQAVADLGASRVSGVVGFSMGGLLALHAAATLDGAASTPVWMLDSFARRVWGQGFLRKVERRLAHALFGRPRDTASDAQADASAPLVERELRATAAQWHLLGAQLVLNGLASPKTRAKLIQARSSPMRSGLIWQRHNNGFAPRNFASWAVHKIDGSHLDLPRHLAASTAQIILRN